jgi:hypothetical protein
MVISGWNSGEWEIIVYAIWISVTEGGVGTWLYRLSLFLVDPREISRHFVIEMNKERPFEFVVT